jgi:hypothetical protein
MKTAASKIDLLFKNERREQPVRLIKAAQASKLLGIAAPAHNHADTKGAGKKPEIRLVRATAEYCDLEVTCGCGESTQVRCWNTPAQQAVAA